MNLPEFKRLRTWGLFGVWAYPAGLGDIEICCLVRVLRRYREIHQLRHGPPHDSRFASDRSPDVSLFTAHVLGSLYGEAFEPRSTS